MMAKETERRLSVLERQVATSGSQRPLWVSVQTEAEAAATVAQHGGRIKVYVGVSPDDWDIEHEPSGSAPERP